MIQALILDLDNCLAPAREVGDALYEPAFNAIREANQNTLSVAALDIAFRDVWSHPFDWVAKTHGFSRAMRQAGWDAFSRMEVDTNLRGYGDLAVLPELSPRRFLVTSGFERLQKSKIAALGIARHFTSIHIDAIDAPVRVGKQSYFEQIMDQHGLAPASVLVVGDNEHSEIAAGNKLGTLTAQTLRPEVVKSPKADYHVSGLHELKSLIDGKLSG